jgi:hypothetical protein
MQSRCNDTDTGKTEKVGENLSHCGKIKVNLQNKQVRFEDIDQPFSIFLPWRNP